MANHRISHQQDMQHFFFPRVHQNTKVKSTIYNSFLTMNQGEDKFVHLGVLNNRLYFGSYLPWEPEVNSFLKM